MLGGNPGGVPGVLAGAPGAPTEGGVAGRCNGILCGGVVPVRVFTI